MESLEMFEPVTGLEDLVEILEAFFTEATVWVRLEMQDVRGEAVHDHILAQFAATFDLCDIVQSETGDDVAFEFLFRELVEQVEEPRMITLPIDPQDIEVDLSEAGITLDSRNFTLSLRRIEATSA